MRTIVFLRAINTPGRRATMQDLRDAVAKTGVETVQSFIASGNLIVDSNEPVDASDIEAAIEAELGFSTTAFLRSDSQILEVISSVPFTDDSGIVEIAFFESPIPISASMALAEAASGVDDLRVAGRELYWWRPLPLVPPIPKESTVLRLVGMRSTRRTLRTVQGIASKFIEST
jgi:uncharacterized protein (DUF1697 family)